MEHYRHIPLRSDDGEFLMRLLILQRGVGDEEI